MSFRKEFKKVVACLTGRVITFYDKEGKVLGRNIYGTMKAAVSVFSVLEIKEV